MVWLPVMAAAGALVTLIAIAGPIVAVLGTGRAAIVIALFAASVVSTFVTMYFNVALVFAATERIEGRTPTVGGCLALAWGRRATIVRWALLAAVVGTVVRALEQRLGIFGRLLGFAGAFAWAVATFLVLPVLAFEQVGPLEALRRSSSILKERFGTVARSGLRFGAMFIVWLLAALAVLLVGAALVPASPIVGVPVAAVGLFCVLAVSMYASAVGTYMRTILYRFATGQSVPDFGVDLAATFSSTPAR